ncbi:MAG TPA: cyclase family protein [Thermoplasmata archaeon]|nr:cyclase family protein [Thermoplasmata archaeon]
MRSEATVRWVDVSLPLGPHTPAFPGDPPVELAPVTRMDRGGPYALSRLTLGTHAGTHLDPPRHFFPDAPGVDRIDPDLLIGPAVVVEVADEVSVIGPAEVDAAPRGTVRLLFRTRNSARWAAGAGFFPDFVALSLAGADRAVARGVRLVGVDALSVESGGEPRYPVHRRLLAAGIAIVEGLVLDAVPPGPCEFACLPLRLVDGDGGPARALVARPAGAPRASPARRAGAGSGSRPRSDSRRRTSRSATGR